MSETTTNARGYAALSEEQREIAKEKQIVSMKEKWQDPVYKAKVSLGRATNAVAKLENQIADVVAALEVATDEEAVSLNETKATLEGKLEKATEKLVAAEEAYNAVKPEDTATEEESTEE